MNCLVEKIELNTGVKEEYEDCGKLFAYKRLLKWTHKGTFNLAQRGVLTQTV
jgi:hypothetical protein